MAEKKLLFEKDLAALAKKFRGESGRKRAQAAREMGVSHVSIHRAEENSKESLTQLRTRMIEAYSPFKVKGPVFYLTRR
jgi:DNA-binding XRE family transcriptional regulator